MKLFKKLPSLLLLVIFTLLFQMPTAEALEHYLKRGNERNAIAIIDDTAPHTGLYSFIVEGSERLYRQWFWYRIGSTGKEASIESLSLTNVIPPSVTHPNTLTLTYTLPATFEITVNYILTYPIGGNARLQKNVTIQNISASDLDYHLFEYSDFDISSIADQNDNVEAVGNKIYQNGEQNDGSGMTVVHESTLPPSSYDFDNVDIFLFPDLNDDAPTELSTPQQTTYRYDNDMQFALQWDLGIPAGQSVSFTINDDFYYTHPMAGTKTHTGCAGYGGEVQYTIAFDNLANSLDSLSNVKIIDFLPTNTTPTSTPPADGALYDQNANSVTWNLSALAAGSNRQEKQLAISVNSSADFTNEVILVSDQTFPVRISDPTMICNRPPTMNAVANASIKEGAPFNLQISAQDPDVQDSLTYSLSGAPTGMTISTSGLISYPVGIAGVYPITVTATDSSAAAFSVSRSFTLTVDKTNQPPVFTSSPVLFAAYNRLYTYEITGTDPEGDTLIFGLIKAPLGMSITGNVVSWVPTTAQTEVPDIKAMIYDGKHYVYQDFTITVVAEPESKTLAVKFITDGNGRLVGTTNQTVSAGASTTFISAIPSTGYYFVNWTGTGGFVTTTRNPMIVAGVTTDQTITANFSTTPPLTFTVTPTVGANGSIRPENSQTVTAGTTTSFSVIPNPGYQISNVTGCGGSLNGTTFIVPAVTGNCTVSATFMAVVSPRSKGDLDGNGTETIADALLALQFAIGIKKASAADIGFGDVAPIINGRSVPDGVIDIADAVAFLQKTVGLLNWQ